ncbi:uncharacterized protein LOC143039348 [Oratosquilla oratoria]|uniref:uncharacterized protein LOC143039348 n=1 Tax=Oratosquilla oratoria TaxID=337810 RepID=UPI003F7609B8
MRLPEIAGFGPMNSVPKRIITSVRDGLASVRSVVENVFSRSILYLQCFFMNVIEYYNDLGRPADNETENSLGFKGTFRPRSCKPDYPAKISIESAQPLSHAIPTSSICKLEDQQGSVCDRYDEIMADVKYLFESWCNNDLTIASSQLHTSIKGTTEDSEEAIESIRSLFWKADASWKIKTKIEMDDSVLESIRRVGHSTTHLLSCRSGDSPAVALSPNAWFPQEKGEKALDIPALFERAQDQPKTVPPRRHIPSSFPVVLPPPFAPEGLRDCLWHSGRDPALPHQLSEPETKLLTTEASTRQDLASTISTVTAIAMMRNWLTTLATSFEDFPREELRDTLAALSTVAEGTANMASSALPPAARAFTAARLAARQSAARSAPEIARRGVVRAAPLSRGLFDQEATDRVFATVPTVIQIQQPSQPRPRPLPAYRSHSIQQQQQQKFKNF